MCTILLMTDCSKKKRSWDVNALAKDIVDDATDGKPTKNSVPEPDTEDKAPKAVKAGRLGDLKGGKARAKKLIPDERRVIAKKAADARWKKQSSGN